MGICQKMNAGFYKIAACIFYMVRAPIVQKIDFLKKRNSSCMDNTAITDFETGEMICQNCGIVLQDNISYDRRDDNTFPKSAY